MTTPQHSTIPCPSCGAAATGKFCTQCGAVVREANCSNCGVALTPGSKFCHDCGTPVAAVAAQTPRAGRTRVAQGATNQGSSNTLPWVLGALALVTLVVIYAAQQAGQTPSSPMPATPSRGAAAVDISSMTPQEQASRLFDRIMTLSEQGKQDSVQLFAPMAMQVFESLGPLDHDARYDLGRIAQVSGQLDIAKAQADTILAQSPNHLLGLILAAAVADARGNQAERATFERRLLAAEAAQLALPLDEYTRHRADIDGAIAAARRRP